MKTMVGDTGEKRARGHVRKERRRTREARRRRAMGDGDERGTVRK